MGDVTAAFAAVTGKKRGTPAEETAFARALEALINCLDRQWNRRAARGLPPHLRRANDLDDALQEAKCRLIRRTRNAREPFKSHRHILNVFRNYVLRGAIVDCFNRNVAHGHQQPPSALARPRQNDQQQEDPTAGYQLACVIELPPALPVEAEELQQRIDDLQATVDAALGDVADPERLVVRRWLEWESSLQEIAAEVDSSLHAVRQTLKAFERRPAVRDRVARVRCLWPDPDEVPALAGLVALRGVARLLLDRQVNRRIDRSLRGVARQRHNRGVEP
jgi:hypothetical protein